MSHLGHRTCILLTAVYEKTESSTSLSRAAILDCNRGLRVEFTFGYILKQISVINHARNR